MKKGTKRTIWTIAVIVGILVFIKLCWVGESWEQMSRAEKLAEETRINNIIRVFTHEPGVYSFLVPDENSILKPTRKYEYPIDDVRLPTDVPPGKPMWAREYHVADKNETGKIISPPRPKFEIHMHSAKDIEGRGQTSVVE